MLLGAFVLLFAASVPLAGGRLGDLSTLHFRAKSLAVSAIAIQILVISVLPGGENWAYSALHVASYALLGAFLITNRGVPGLWLIAIGGALNLIVIAANGGVMPASPGAMEAAGLRHDATDFSNSTAVDDPKLAFLGDVFAVPQSFPLHNVFSVGDVLIVVGVAVLLHRVCGSRLAPASRRRLQPAA